MKEEEEEEITSAKDLGSLPFFHTAALSLPSFEYITVRQIKKTHANKAGCHHREWARKLARTVFKPKCFCHQSLLVLLSKVGKLLEQLWNN